MSVIHISRQGAYLRINAGRFVVSFKDEELLSVPEAAVERVVIVGNAQVSTQAVSRLLQLGIGMVYLSVNGRFKGFLAPGYPKNAAVRIAQYDASINPAAAIAFAKAIVEAKLAAQSEILDKWRRNRWLETDPLFNRAVFDGALRSAADITAVRGVEAAAAKFYFADFAAVIPPPFEWSARSRRPPTDPVNAMLSLTYMMCLGELVGMCHGRGVDPQIGFLHQLDYTRPSFALDILEPLRSLFCDHFVVKSLRAESFEPGDFTFSDTNGCRLAPVALERYFKLLREFSRGGRRGSWSLNTFSDAMLRLFAESFRTGAPPDIRAMVDCKNQMEP